MLQTAFQLTLFLFPLAFSPGRGNMFFAANGARFGLAATFPATFGSHLTTWLVTAGIGFGFIAVFDQFPSASIVLKLAGSAYVLWIAFRFFRAGTHDASLDAWPASFMDGAVLLLLNPKAYVIIALIFTQFLEPSLQSSAIAILLVTTTFTLKNFVAFTIWTIAGELLALQFQIASRARTMNICFGALLGGVVLWILFS